MKDFNKQDNLDVLQNIEVGIIRVYRTDPSVLDVDAQDAIDALVRHYRDEDEGRGQPTLRLDGRARAVYDSVQGMCEWRLGRGPDPVPPGPDEPPVDPISVGAMVTCLRAIQKSIPKWTRQGGKRGYLDFVGQYLP